MFFSGVFTGFTGDFYDFLVFLLDFSLVFKCFYCILLGTSIVSRIL